MERGATFGIWQEKRIVYHRNFVHRWDRIIDVIRWQKRKIIEVVGTWVEDLQSHFGWMRV